jgi:hypothetical protein
MPLSPSNFSTSSFFRSSSCGSDASFPLSSSSSLAGLPPPAPHRRYTPVRRGLGEPSLMFQARPLKNLSVVSRSPSPCSSASGRASLPRRVFPQVGASVGAGEVNGKEDSPVVFDANLTFVLGCKGRMRQNVKPVPAHMDTKTASNVLTNKIADFLRKTDHVMDEWKRFGHRDDEYDMRRLREQRAGRSRSATNILIKGFQLFSRSSSCSRSSVARDFSNFSNGDCTEAEADEVLSVRSVRGLKKFGNVFWGKILFLKLTILRK